MPCGASHLSVSCLNAFQEDAQDDDVTDAVKSNGQNPTVVVRGVYVRRVSTLWDKLTLTNQFWTLAGTIFDEDVKVEVRILDDISIEATDVLQGILTGFMSFMVMDFYYTKEIHSFLEFTQRFVYCT